MLARPARFGQKRTDNSGLFAKTVMKSIIAACLLIASNVALADPPANGCGKFASTDIVSAPMTIAEIERQEMDRLSQHLKIRPDYPRVPFGFMNAEWKVFKSMSRPGDKFVRYSTDEHSWQHLAGEAGVAVIRSGCLIGMLPMERS